MPNIACVIVFFNPTALSMHTVSRLAAHAYPVVVVVNKADDAQVVALAGLAHVHVIQNAYNVGLATALNQGLGFAFSELAVDYVVAFDQDSVPDLTLPQQLAQELEADDSQRLACLGPMLVDRKSVNAAYTYDQQKNLSLGPRTIPTSGTLITRDSWHNVGPMLDDLFIDGIDHEWCFRAYAKGYRVGVSRHVAMLHDMGDTGVRVWGRYKPIHRSPIRHYFIVRNTLYLCSLAYVPAVWKMSELLKTVRRMVVYLLVSTNRMKTLKLMTRAVQDGVRGRLGPCPV